MSKKTPSEIFKAARLKSGLTQVEVAKQAGINSNSYARIERGEQEPSVITLKKLAKALDIPLQDVMAAWE